MRSEFINIKDKKRIGVMGGTFDPIHNGHLTVAKNAKEKYNLDKIIFVPNGQPNFKQDKYVTEKKYRLEMTMLAINNTPDFLLSSLEIDKKGVSYTYDTIQTLNFFAHKDAEFFFILGSDVIFDIEKWHRAEELFKLCSFIIVNRGGFSKSKTIEKSLYLEKKYNSKMYFLEMGDIHLSSTEIRQKLYTNEEITSLIPKEVENYIKKNYVYENKYKSELVGENVKRFMSSKRYIHTLRVVEEGLKLAKHYNVSKEKVFLGTCLHDVAKEFNKKQTKSCAGKSCDEMDFMLGKYPSIAHGFVGAEVAKDYFGITDEEVLNSIKYHTTGRPNMSLLEKIVFIADKIEAGRKEFDVLDEMRRLAYEDIDKSIILCINSTIGFLKKKNGNVNIHRLSIETLNYLLDDLKEV